ncbi:MAG: hypothetical protein AABZ30_14720 [Myxococcota bacterium]
MRFAILCVLAVVIGGCKEEADDVVSTDGGVRHLEVFANVPLADQATDLAIVDDVAYVLDLLDLSVIPVADPAAATIVGNALLPGTGLHAVGESIYIAFGSQLWAGTLADGTVVSKGAIFDFSPRGSSRVFVRGEYAYVASGTDVLGIDLEESKLILILGIGGIVQDVAATDSLAFAAAGSRGLMIVDVSQSPPGYRPIKTDGDALAVFVLSEDEILVGTTESITIFDVKDATMPRRRGRVSLGTDAAHPPIFYATSDRAYVIGGACPGGAGLGFHAYDLEERDELREIACDAMPSGVLTGLRALPIGARGLVVDGDLAALVIDRSLALFEAPITAVAGKGEGKGEGEGEGELLDEGPGGFVDGGT